MAGKVVDASAACALVFGEPAAEAVATRLSGFRLAAPALLPFEVANTYLTKLRRHPTERDRLLAGFGLFERMRIDLVEVEHRSVLDLAEETRLTVYDASYLWLSRRLGVELVTLDGRLVAASGG